MLKAFLLSEVLRTPAWAWILLVNLAAALACVVALFVETKPMARPRHALLVAALVALAAMAGILIAGGYALVFWLEARLWRQHVSATPARRIH